MPLTYTVMVACVVTFMFFNGAIVVASMRNESLLSQWIDVSQPFTDWISSVVPSVQDIANNLKARTPRLLTATVQNALATNVALFLVFPLLTLLSAPIDLARQGAVKIVTDINETYKWRGRSIPDFIGAFSILLPALMASTYLGIGPAHYAVNLQICLIGDAIMFCVFSISFCNLIALSLAYVCGRFAGVEL